MVTEIGKLNIRKNKGEIITELCVVIACSYIFLKYYIPKSLGYLLLIILLAIFSSRKKSLLTVQESHAPFVVCSLLFGGYLLLSTTWTIAPHTTFATSVLTLVTLLIGIAALNQREFFRLLPKAILLFSLIQMIGIFMPLFAPSLYLAIIARLPAPTYENAVGFLSIGRFCGFTQQTAIAGFYMSIGIAVIFNTLLFKKHKLGATIFYWAALILEIIALIMTFKRGPMICVVLSVIVILIYNKKVSVLSIVKYGLVILVLGIVAINVLSGIPEVSDVVDRSFDRFGQQKGHDIVSGRGELNDRAMTIFENDPLLGIGYGSYAVDFIHGTHNVYLEIICESGILGMLVYIPYLLVNLWKVIQCIRRKNGDLMLLNLSLFIQLFYIVHSAVENCLTDNYVFLTYVLMTAVPYAVETKNVREAIQPSNRLSAFSS